MDEQERYETGMAMRRRVLGDAHVNRVIAGATPAPEDFHHLIARYVWGDIWTRPGLDVRTRRLLVIGTLVALGRWEELEMHVAAALAARDLSVAEIREIVLQQAIYCGVPAAHHAFEVLGPLLKD